MGKPINVSLSCSSTVVNLLKICSYARKLIFQKQIHHLIKEMLLYDTEQNTHLFHYLCRSGTSLLHRNILNRAFKYMT